MDENEIAKVAERRSERATATHLASVLTELACGRYTLTGILARSAEARCDAARFLAHVARRDPGLETAVRRRVRDAILAPDPVSGDRAAAAVAALERVR